MYRNSTLKGALSLVLSLLLGSIPLVCRAQAFQDRVGTGQGVHRDDPCDQLPDPSGKAKGIDKLCPGGGSSSGIAKGDFNGDG